MTLVARHCKIVVAAASVESSAIVNEYAARADVNNDSGFVSYHEGIDLSFGRTETRPVIAELRARIASTTGDCQHEALSFARTLSIWSEVVKEN